MSRIDAFSQGLRFICAGCPDDGRTWTVETRKGHPDGDHVYSPRALVVLADDLTELLGRAREAEALGAEIAPLREIATRAVIVAEHDLAGQWILDGGGSTDERARIARSYLFEHLRQGEKNVKALPAQDRLYHFHGGRTLLVESVDRLTIYATGCHENHSSLTGKTTIVPPWEWTHVDIAAADVTSAAEVNAFPAKRGALELTLPTEGGGALVALTAALASDARLIVLAGTALTKVDLCFRALFGTASNPTGRQQQDVLYFNDDAARHYQDCSSDAPGKALADHRRKGRPGPELVFVTYLGDDTLGEAASLFVERYGMRVLTTVRAASKESALKRVRALVPSVDAHVVMMPEDEAHG